MKFIHALVVVVFSIPMAVNLSAGQLVLKLDESNHTISAVRTSSEQTILTQTARPDFRPYIHPIVAPDGNGILTDNMPGHHRHQNGLYWGFTRVNGRDYFHHPEGTHWKRVSIQLLKAESTRPGDSVQWQTVYDLLAEDGSTVMTESQIWTLRDFADNYSLDLEWTGTAKVEVTIGEYDYGGLFLRMPWKPGIKGRVFNGARQSNERAEGQRSVWVDVGMQVEGRKDPAHIAIFDHPKNKGFPQPWRVDGQLGVGPVRARLGDWTISKGQSETIRHRLVIYTGELDDVSLTQQWSAYTGQGMAWAQWRLAQEEGRRAEFLTPEQAVDTMTVQPEFRANVFAAEPMIAQPMAFCWDSKGRLWVAENFDYETRQSGFANDGNSRIVILEDTDRDGVADSKKVFLEGVPFPAGMAVGMGGLWLGAPPNLLFVPDANNDDKADVEDIEVRLTGWGIRDRHETLNSFLWGPDGWLYGCQGYATPSRVGKPAGDGKLYSHKDPFPEDIAIDGPATDINGGVWRYHPTKDRFEVVAHGFSNPWGIDYDKHGQLFITACVIPHLWHVIPGGIYHRQGGSHYNPYVYNDIKTIADHRHRSAHGGARIYQSDAFPNRYQDRIFMANIHEHAVLTDILEPNGSGFVGRHGDDFALANNAQWVGFSLEIGPDGNLYALDWHDADICGKEVLNKDTGRIFRFAPRQSTAEDFPERFGDLAARSDLQLAKLQTSGSNWHARRARLELQHRSVSRRIDPQALAFLSTLLEGKDTVHRLRALWSLSNTGNVTRQQLIQWLADADPHIQAWSIRLLCEDGLATSDIVDTLVQMPQQTDSPVVRRALASCLQRVEHTTVWPVARTLCQFEKDNNDHNLPKMIWFAIEPYVVSDSQKAVKLAQTSKLHLVTRHVARRLTDAEKFDVLLPAITSAAESSQIEMLLGLRDALDGRFDLKSPPGWTQAYAKLRAAGDQQARIALQLSQQFTDGVAAEAMLATLASQTTSLPDRQQALKTLAGQKRQELLPELETLLQDPNLRTAAIQAVAAYDSRQLGLRLLELYASLDEADRLEVIQTLASRSEYANLLTDAIADGRVPKKEVPTWVAQLMRRTVGPKFAEVWGSFDELSSEKQALFTKFRTLLTDDNLATADAAKGRAIFNKTCASCHRLYGYGQQIGPDITGANRGNMEYLLSNILTPSAVIQDAYKMQIVLTLDGRVFSGIPAGETERAIKLKVINEDDPITIPKSQIESRETAKVSLMPEGQLKFMSDQEVLNLFKYLQSTSQIELPQAP